MKFEGIQEVLRPATIVKRENVNSSSAGILVEESYHRRTLELEEAEVWSMATEILRYIRERGAVFHVEYEGSAPSHLRLFFLYLLNVLLQIFVFILIFIYIEVTIISNGT